MLKFITENQTLDSLQDRFVLTTTLDEAVYSFTQGPGEFNTFHSYRNCKYQIY